MPPSPASLADLDALPWPSGGAGWRHLARARARVRPPGALPRTAALWGASGAALTLARALAARGVAVVVVEPDTDAARRLADALARAAPGVRVLRRSAKADLVVECAGAGAPPSPGALAVSLVPGAAAGWLPARIVGAGCALVESAGGPGADRLAGVVAALGGVALPVPAPFPADSPAARMLARIEGAAELLAFAGAAPWDVDEAALAAGWTQGPCAGMDARGVDAALPRLARRRAAHPALPEPGVIARMVVEGRLGTRASVGWYRYPGGGGRVVDPLIDDLVREEAHFARRKPVTLPAPLIARALALAVVDEAARIRAEGGVHDAAHLDLAAVLVCGWPPAWGGPVFLGRLWGDRAIRAALRALATVLPDWPPAFDGGPLDGGGVPGQTGNASPVKRRGAP